MLAWRLGKTLSVDLTAILAATLTLGVMVALNFGLSWKRESRAFRGVDCATIVSLIASGSFMGVMDVITGFFVCGSFSDSRGIGAAGLVAGVGTALSLGLPPLGELKAFRRFNFVLEIQFGAAGGAAGSSSL